MSYECEEVSRIVEARGLGLIRSTQQQIRQTRLGHDADSAISKAWGMTAELKSVRTSGISLRSPWLMSPEMRL